MNNQVPNTDPSLSAIKGAINNESFDHFIERIFDMCTRGKDHWLREDLLSFLENNKSLPAAVSEVMLPPNGLCWFGDGSCKKPQTNTSFYCADHEHKKPVAPQGTVEETEFTETDCSSRAGIVVGLVDGVIAIAQTWNRLLTHPMPDDPAVIAAFKDMRSNKDVQEFFGVTEFDALMANFRSDFPLGKPSSGSGTQQGTVEGALRPLRECIWCGLGKPDGHDCMVEKEQGRWQQAIYRLLVKATDDSIDGGGCDSGDPLDFTLDEIGQAIRILKERAEATNE